MKQEPQTFIDYSNEVKPVNSKFVRFILISFSFIFLALGIIGIFLPVLPTTPFILLSAFLYARSSSKFYNWMMNHPILGPPLRDWKVKGSIPIKAKILAVFMICATIIPSIIFVVPIFEVKILLGIIGLSVIAYILSRPS